MPSHINAARALARRCSVAELLLQGVTNHRQIALRLGVQRRVISYDVAAVEKQWRAAAIKDRSEQKALELAKLDLAEKEAWAAWERSRTDPRWLKLVLDVIARRAALLGLDEVPPEPTAHIEVLIINGVSRHDDGPGQQRGPVVVEARKALPAPPPDGPLAGYLDDR
jgi:hypothetical protein